jgi:hypothetical protein
MSALQGINWKLAAAAGLGALLGAMVIDGRWGAAVGGAVGAVVGSKL